MRINIFKNNIISRVTLFSCFILTLLLIVPVSVTDVYGQQGLRGMMQNYNAFQTTPDYEFIAARNRFRLQYDPTIEIGNLYTEIDLVHKYAEKSTIDLNLRELYFDWYFEQSDLRIGKQKINWGKATGAFVTDILSPLDLTEFLTQEPSDLILGITAANYTRYYGNNSLQFVFSPIFEPDQFPSQDSRWFPIQLVDTPVSINFIENQQAPTLKSMQFAMRYGLRAVENLDLDLIFNYWTHPTPAYALTLNLTTFPNPPEIELVESYQVSPMAGYSLNWQFHPNWALQSELLFVNERLFTFLPVSINRLENALNNLGEAILVLQEFEIRDDGYLLKKPWIHSMLGLQTEVWGTIVNVQGYLETIIDYEDRILPQQYFPYITVLLNKTTLRDRLQLQALSRYNIYGKDSWYQFQGVYELSDGLEMSFGTNLFAGEEITPFYGHFSFYHFRQNSFIFSRISLFF